MRIRSLGIRHAALPAKDLKRGIRFYTEILGFQPYHVEDADWAMLHTEGTTLSLVQLPKRLQTDEPQANQGTHPRHLGLVLETREDVDQWNERLKAQKIPGIGTPKLHRDQSYGFYLLDSEGNQIEIIFIPQAPMAFREKDRAILVVTESIEPEIVARWKRNFPDTALEVVQASQVSAAIQSLRTKVPDLKKLDVIGKLSEKISGIEIKVHPSALDSPLVQEALIADAIQKISQSTSSSKP
ncbi:MAG: VOC family protein [Bdellovibrionales bacterium]|nr:VOC family protein [Bdellovibrionales bacterium]